MAGVNDRVQRWVISADFKDLVTEAKAAREALDGLRRARSQYNNTADKRDIDDGLSVDRKSVDSINDTTEALQNMVAARREDAKAARDEKASYEGLTGARKKDRTDLIGYKTLQRNWAKERASNEGLVQRARKEHIKTIQQERGELSNLVKEQATATRSARNRTSALDDIAQAQRNMTKANRDYAQSQRDASATDREAASSLSEESSAASRNTNATNINKAAKSGATSMRRQHNAAIRQEESSLRSSTAAMDDHTESLRESERSQGRSVAKAKELSNAFKGAGSSAKELASELSDIGDVSADVSGGLSKTADSSARSGAASRRLSAITKATTNYFRQMGGSVGFLSGLFNESANRSRLLGMTMKSIPLATMASGFRALVPVVGALGSSFTGLIGTITPMFSLLGMLPSLAAGAIGGIAGAFAGLAGVFGVVGKYNKAQEAIQQGAYKTAGATKKSAAEQSRDIRKTTNDIQKARKDRIRSAEDIKDAEANVARTARENSRLVINAEQDVADAQKDAKAAQQDVTRARRDATRQLRDYQLQLRGAALDEESASISLAESKLRLTEVLNDPGATNLERRAAKLAVKEATLRLDEVRAANSDLSQDASEAARKGVEGSDMVVAAKDAEVDANRRLQDAQYALADANYQAQENTRQAQRQLEDAKQAYIDSGLRVEELTAELAKLKSGTDESSKAAAAGATQMAAYNAAMAELGPNARLAVNELIKFSDIWKDIQYNAQEAIAPGLVDFLRSMETIMPVVDAWITRMARGTGEWAASFGRMIAHGEGMNGLITPMTAVSAIMEDAYRNMEKLGQFINNTSAALLGVGLAAERSGLTDWIADITLGWSENWKQIAMSEEGQLRLQRAMHRGMYFTEQWGRVFANTFGAMGNMFRYLGDILGIYLLDGLVNLTQKWEDWSASIEGKNTMERWASNAKVTLENLGETIGLVFDMFSRLTEQDPEKSGAQIERFWTKIQEILQSFEPILALVDDTMINLILDLADAFVDFFAALGPAGIGVIESFIGALTNTMRVLSDLVSAFAENPAGLKVIEGLIVLFGGKKAIEVFGNLVGLPGMLGAIETTGAKGYAPGAKGMGAFTLEALGFGALVPKSKAAGADVDPYGLGSPAEERIQGFLRTIDSNVAKILLKMGGAPTTDPGRSGDGGGDGNAPGKGGKDPDSDGGGDGAVAMTRSEKRAAKRAEKREKRNERKTARVERRQKEKDFTEKNKPKEKAFMTRAGLGKASKAKPGTTPAPAPVKESKARPAQSAGSQPGARLAPGFFGRAPKPTSPVARRGSEGGGGYTSKPTPTSGGKAVVAAPAGKLKPVAGAKSPAVKTPTPKTKTAAPKGGGMPKGRAAGVAGLALVVGAGISIFGGSEAQAADGEAADEKTGFIDSLIEKIAGARRTVTTFITMWGGVGPAIQAAFRIGMEKLQEWIAAQGGLGPALMNFMFMLMMFGPIVTGVFKMIAGSVLGIGKGFIMLFRIIGPIMGTILRLVTSSFMTILRVGIMAIRGITMAMMANPWMLLVAAIVVVVLLVIKYWDQIKEAIGIALTWIGNLLQGWGAAIQSAWNVIWGAIKAAALFVWNGILNGISIALNTIITVVRAVLYSIFAVWTAIWTAVQVAAAVVWGFIRVAISTAINVVLIVISTVMGIILAVWQAIWNTIRTVVTTIFSMIVTVVSTAINVVRTVITTVMNIIQVIWSAVWNTIITVLRGIFAIIKALVSGDLGRVRDIFLQMGERIRQIWGQTWDRIWLLLRVAFARIITSVVGAIGSLINKWRNLGTRLHEIWNNMWTRIRGVLDRAKAGVENTFQNLVDGVKRIWDKVKNIVKDPIKIILKFVNEGIGGMIGKVAGFFGIENTPFPIVIPGFDEGGWTGHGSKHKPAGIVHADEFVVKKESRKRIERTHPGMLDHMNRTGTAPGYAEGGRVRPVSQSESNNYSGHSGIDYRTPMNTPVRAAGPGTIFYTGTGRGYGIAIFQNLPDGMKAVYGHLNKTGVKAGDSVEAGQVIGWSGNTGNSTGPHLHFEVTGGGFANSANRATTRSWLRGAKIIGGGEEAPDDGEGFFQRILPDWVKNALNFWKKPFETLKNGISAIGNSPWLSGMTDVGTFLKDKALDKLNQFKERWLGSGDGSGEFGAGSQQDIAFGIADVAHSRGMGDRGALLGIMTAMQESGLKNIKHGDRDSVGLFQQRPSMGWGTVDQIMNPTYASNKFFDALSRYDWQSGPEWEDIQAAQRSGFPRAYQKHKGRAQKYVDAWKAARGYDRGGWTGPGNKYDPAGIVHADEFVVKKESRRKIERKSPGILDHMNRTGEVPNVLHGPIPKGLPNFPGYAKGGVVKRVSPKQYKLPNSLKNMTVYLSYMQEAFNHDKDANPREAMWETRNQTRILEHLLYNEGVLSSPWPNGHFGTYEMKAFNDWQKKNKLKTTENVDSASLSKLLKKYGVKYNSKQPFISGTEQPRDRYDSALGSVMKSNADQRKFQSYINKIRAWGFNYAYDNLKSGGPDGSSGSNNPEDPTGMELAEFYSKNKARAKEYNDALKEQSKLEQTDDLSGKMGELASILAYGDNPALSLTKAAEELGVSVDTAAMLFKEVNKANWLKDISASRTRRIRGDVADFDNLFKFAKGGIVPGHGDYDKVLSLLTPGELVVPKDVVQDLFSGNVGFNTPLAFNGVPVPSRNTGGGTVVNEYNFNTTVNNPHMEEGARSVEKRVRGVASLGILGGRRG